MTTKHHKHPSHLLAIALLAGSGIGLSQATEATSEESKALLLFSQAKISLTDAIKTAEKAIGGKALEADLDDGAKTVQFEVEVVKDGKIHKVMVDGVTGSVLTATMADEADDDAENDKD